MEPPPFAWARVGPAHMPVSERTLTGPKSALRGQELEVAENQRFKGLQPLPGGRLAFHHERPKMVRNEVAIIGDMDVPLSKGTVKTWYREEGWGSIQIEGVAAECFAHFSSIVQRTNEFLELVPGEDEWSVGMRRSRMNSLLLPTALSVLANRHRNSPLVYFRSDPVTTVRWTTSGRSFSSRRSSENQFSKSQSQLICQTSGRKNQPCRSAGFPVERHGAEGLAVSLMPEKDHPFFAVLLQTNGAVDVGLLPQISRERGNASFTESWKEKGT